MYEALIETIAAEHPELHYDNLQTVFPASVVQLSMFRFDNFYLRWNDVDWANPGPSVH